MSLSNVEALKNRISVSLSDLTNNLGSEALFFAAEQAVNELNITFPISSGTIQMWATLRGKRHALDLLRTAAAYKFQYKQIHLEHRFKQLSAQIEQMDKEFEEAKKTEPELFGLSVTDGFGVYLGNGFVYDQYGNDITRVLKELGLDNKGYRERYV